MDNTLILQMVEKFLGFFFQPLGALLFFSFLLFWTTKKRFFFKKLISLIVFGSLFALSYAPVANQLSAPLESKHKKYNHQSAQYIVVLGNGHNENPALPVSSSLSPAATQRTLEAVLIYKELSKRTKPTPANGINTQFASNLNLKSNTLTPKIIFTGAPGSKQKTSNAKMNANLAQALGVPKHNIVILGQEKNTLQEAKSIRKIVGKNTVILVTSAMHMPRSMLLFKLNSVKTVAAPTDFKTNTASYLALPRLSYLVQSNLAIHEMLGTAWVRLKGNFETLLR
jgi:uncharacterized SAM-binding protein YcdF (DUF218 family)